jgi:hypothetical protein
MMDHPPMPWHVVKLLGYVFTEITTCAAALRAARFVGLQIFEPQSQLFDLAIDLP